MASVRQSRQSWDMAGGVSFIVQAYSERLQAMQLSLGTSGLMKHVGRRLNPLRGGSLKSLGRLAAMERFVCQREEAASLPSCPFVHRHSYPKKQTWALAPESKRFKDFKIKTCPAGDLRERALAETSGGQLGMLGAEAFIHDFVSPREAVQGSTPTSWLEQSDAESPESPAIEGPEDPLVEALEVGREDPLTDAGGGAYSLPASPSGGDLSLAGALASRDPRLRASEGASGRVDRAEGIQCGGATASAPASELRRDRQAGACSPMLDGGNISPTRSRMNGHRADSRGTADVSSPPSASLATAGNPASQISATEIKAESGDPSANPSVAPAPGSSTQATAEAAKSAHTAELAESFERPGQ